jgi:hypothetical protein
MELGYILLAADVALGIARWGLYRAQARAMRPPALLESELLELEAARRAARAALEEVARERAELEATLRRAERLVQQWGEVVSSEPPVDASAEAKLADSLRALRRS